MRYAAATLGPSFVHDVPHSITKLGELVKSMCMVTKSVSYAHGGGVYRAHHYRSGHDFHGTWLEEPHLRFVLKAVKMLYALLRSACKGGALSRDAYLGHRGRGSVAKR
jgi:hypothetical protein